MLCRTMSDLKEKYNKVYKEGKDNFHSVMLKDIYDGEKKISEKAFQFLCKYFL